MYKTELDWVSAYKKLEVELENKNTQIVELEKENAELKKTVEHYRKEREFFISEVEK